ncbi:hypothetical protein [Streptomyces scabiei]|uniref:hypothetical protein n=1 Tax=Streptomyces scabiei TaxID=1930 RepID=UPI00069007AB|nr:hypothetical protein [Streptomyces scabiei]
MTTPVRRGRSLRSRLLAYISGAISRLRTAWNLLTTAQDRLLKALGMIRPSRNGIGRKFRQAMDAYNTALAAFAREAGAFTERWAATDLPLIYREGAWTLLDNANRRSDVFTWTARHQQAITSLSAQYYADLTARIREAVRRAQAFLRAARDASRNTSGRISLTQLRRDHPLGTVIYANNARHPVEAWARSALTWQAVTTANTAACHTALDDLGVSYVEVRDGDECGWRDHQDSDRANRTLRTIQDALAHPTSHAHCIREFLPRLDLVGRTDILSGAPL